MGIDMKFKNSGGVEMEKLDFKITVDLLKKVEEICKRHLINRKNIQEYADFLENMNENFKENAPILLSLIVHNFDEIRKWAELQENVDYGLENLKSYGKYIKRIQMSLSRPFSYSNLVASGTMTGGVYYHLIRNDGQSFVLDLNNSEVLDICGELLRIVSQSIDPKEIDKKCVAAYMSSTMKVLTKITGKSVNELLSGKNVSVDK